MRGEFMDGALYFMNKPAAAPRDNLDWLHTMYYTCELTDYKAQLVRIYCELYALRRLAHVAALTAPELPAEHAALIRDALENVERSCLELTPPPEPPKAA